MIILFYVIGTVLSLGGFISGIILGINIHNFGFCVLEWLGVFLFVLIYFGIAAILKKQETILGLVNNSSNNTSNSTNAKTNYANTKTSHLRNCILLSSKEFEDVLTKVDKDFSIDFEDIYSFNTAEIRDKLARYYGIEAITSIHLDGFNPTGVWIVYTNTKTNSTNNNTTKKRMFL